MDDNLYAAPKTKFAEVVNTKPGWLLVSLAWILSILSLWNSYSVGSQRVAIGGSYDAGYMFGYTTSQIIMSAMVVLLFQIGKIFRNNRWRTKIYVWSLSILLLMALLNEFAPARH